MQKTQLATMALLTLLTANANAGISLQPIFEKLTTPQNWTWQTFDGLSKTGNYRKGMQKNQYKSGNFYLERSLAGYANARITAYGTQSAPNEVVFYSGGWGITNAKSLINLSDIANPSQLTKLKSNCNFGKIEDIYTGKDQKGRKFSGKNYINGQTIYRWQRPNAIPLYLVALTGGGIMQTSSLVQGINSTVIVVNDAKNLSSAIATHGWNKDNNGKKIPCSIS